MPKKPPPRLAIASRSNFRRDQLETRDQSTPVSGQLFERIEQEMVLRNYALRTIKAYQSCLRMYTRWLEGDAPRQVSDETPRAYLLALIKAGVSRTYVDQNVSALKLLYVELYGWPLDRLAIPRPRRERSLPVVPTRAQVLRLANAIPNPKHRLMLLLMYASGVRVSELVRLRVEDVDLDEVVLRVRDGKGARDRLTIFSERLAPMLREEIGERAQGAPLFESERGGHMSVRSVQHVIQRARRRAGLSQKVTAHSLRHAFATHLLEAGTDIRIIQSFLGHRHIQTTTRYTHIAGPTRRRIKSPL